MSDVRVFAALRSESLEREARIIEEFQRSQLAIVAEVAPINPPAGLCCAVCEKPINSLEFALWGGQTVTHRGPCEIQQELREAMLCPDFELWRWVSE